MNARKTSSLVGLLSLLYSSPCCPDMIASSSAAVAPLAGDEGDVYACGTISLYLLCHLHALQVRLADVDAQLGVPSRSGHSMSQLIRAARSFGLKLHGVKVQSSDLPPFRAAIVYLSQPGPGHFVTIRPVEGEPSLIQILDPPRGPVLVRAEEISGYRGWTGMVLIPEPNTAVCVPGLLLGACALLLFPICFALWRPSKVKSNYFFQR